MHHSCSDGNSSNALLNNFGRNTNGSNQYLQRLQSISKWHHPSHEIKVGVLLTDERSPPRKWPLARVTQLHPRIDNLSRVVTLKTATSQLTRPTTKLVILLVPIKN